MQTLLSMLLHPLLLATLGHALAPAPAAQGNGTRFLRYSRPLEAATLDLASGTLTRGATVRDRAAATVTDFANLDLGGFVGVDSGNGACEWFDAGVKGTGTGATAGVSNDSDLMSSIVFAYCTSAADTSVGGPGGAVKLGFYEGYTQGGGAPTTAVALLTLTGLPGNTATGTFPSVRCFFLRVLFSTLVCFADGPIGYSWKFLDASVLNPSRAATFPYLACVASCSGAPGTVDGQGMQDGIDRYCPPGNLLGTFSFGTTSGSFSSIGLSIQEVVDRMATVATFNSGAFPNPDLLAAPAVAVGQPWAPTLTLGLARTAPASWFCFFGSHALNPPDGVLIPGMVGGLSFGPSPLGRMLLCDLDPNGFSCSGSHTGVVGSTSVASCGLGAIPKRIGLVCNDWCAQALVLGSVPGGGNARLSSAVRGTVGTH